LLSLSPFLIALTTLQLLLLPFLLLLLLALAAFQFLLPPFLIPLLLTLTTLQLLLSHFQIPLPPILFPTIIKSGGRDDKTN
jgi:hypothetical protein